MNLKLGFAFVFTCALTGSSWADDLVKDAAIGGAIGGGLGGAVGAELGGKQGAVIGAGVGAATGAAIATDDDDGHDGHHANQTGVIVVPATQGQFCPPGQAKKGRC